MNSIMPLSAVLVLAIGSLPYLFFPRLLEHPKRAFGLCALVILTAIVFLLDSSGGNEGLARGILVDSFSRLLAVVACVSGLVSVIATSEAVVSEKIETYGEYYFLVLMALCGAVVMILAADFLSLFIGLEVASLALYCLCGARVTKPQSSESSLKYFLLGCFSSAFFLYGVALWYGATGSLSIYSASVTPLTSSSLLMVSFVMLLVGLGFKVGLAPFHLWVPDVYQGAPTSVTTFMSSVVKVAAFAALFKVSIVSFMLPSEWATGILWLVSVLAMTLGNLAALQQRSIKRMLAYSSVAQAGYVTMGLVSASFGAEAIAASIYYLICYCAMTIGCFAVLAVVGPDADDIDSLKGLGSRSPFLATCMTLFFLALAGLPPSLAGLMGKVYLFSATLSAGFIGLSIIAALNSALACAYYLRVPLAMLFQKSAPEQSSGAVAVSLMARASIAGCAAAVVVFGFLPQTFILLALEGAVVLMNH